MKIKAVQNIKVQYSTIEPMHYNTMNYNTLLHDTIHNNTLSANQFQVGPCAPPLCALGSLSVWPHW